MTRADLCLVLPLCVVALGVGFALGSLISLAMWGA
jgi:hypothetical protein